MAALFFRQEWVFSCYSQHIHEDTQLLGRFSLYWGEQHLFEKII